MVTYYPTPSVFQETWGSEVILSMALCRMRFESKRFRKNFLVHISKMQFGMGTVRVTVSKALEIRMYVLSRPMFDNNATERGPEFSPSCESQTLFATFFRNLF